MLVYYHCNNPLHPAFLSAWCVAGLICRPWRGGVAHFQSVTLVTPECSACQCSIKALRAQLLGGFPSSDNPLNFVLGFSFWKTHPHTKNPNVEPCEEHARATDGNIKLTVQKCHSNKKTNTTHRLTSEKEMTVNKFDIKRQLHKCPHINAEMKFLKMFTS